MIPTTVRDFSHVDRYSVRGVFLGCGGAGFWVCPAGLWDRGRRSPDNVARPGRICLISAWLVSGGATVTLLNRGMDELVRRVLEIIQGM